MKKLISVILVLCLVFSTNIFASAETVTAESSTTTMESLLKSLCDIMLFKIVSAILQQNFTEDEILQIGPENVLNFIQKVSDDFSETMIKIYTGTGDLNSEEAELEIIGFRMRLESMVSELAQKLQ